VDRERNLQLRTYRIDSEYVIEVRVSGDDLAGLDLDVVNEADDPLGLIARVDDYRGGI
jgi:hypothetical protein